MTKPSAKKTKAKKSVKKEKAVAVQSDIYQPDTIYPVKEEFVAKNYPRATLVGEFALRSSDNLPMRWYRQDNPDRSKGHKDYFAFMLRGDTMFITGKEESVFESENERIRDGIHCLDCNSVTYSRYRHDFHSCKCGKVSIDGGAAYTKIAFDTGSNYKRVKIDLLTQKVIA